jgi:hypothetical protein
MNKELTPAVRNLIEVVGNFLEDTADKDDLRESYLKVMNLIPVENPNSAQKLVELVRQYNGGFETSKTPGLSAYWRSNNLHDACAFEATCCDLGISYRKSIGVTSVFFHFTFPHFSQ